MSSQTITMPPITANGTYTQRNRAGSSVVVEGTFGGATVEQRMAGTSRVLRTITTADDFWTHLENMEFVVTNATGTTDIDISFQITSYPPK